MSETTSLLRRARRAAAGAGQALSDGDHLPGAWWSSSIAVAPGFNSTGNLLNVLRTVSMLGIIAFGMTAVIVAGEIDLSVGSGAALAGCIVAWFAGEYSETLGAGLAIFAGTMAAIAGRRFQRHL